MTDRKTSSIMHIVCLILSFLQLMFSYFIGFFSVIIFVPGFYPAGVKFVISTVHCEEPPICING